MASVDQAEKHISASGDISLNRFGSRKRAIKMASIITVIHFHVRKKKYFQMLAAQLLWRWLVYQSARVFSQHLRVVCVF